MTYEQLTNNIKDKCIVIDNAMNVAYIRPEWKHILRVNNYIDAHVQDDNILLGIDEIEDMLEKEVAMYNGFLDFKKPINDWLFDILYNKLGPALQKQLKNK